MPQRPTLLIVIASTRPGRVGLPVGRWFAEQARAHGGWDVDVADLAEVDLPFLAEPEHPRLGRYVLPGTIAWSRRVEAADAVVLVTPEYNHSFPATLKNALDHLHREWQHKPVGLVSYGGVSGGTRAAQALKPVLQVLGMVPVGGAVVIPFVQRHLDTTADATVLRADDTLDGAAKVMLDDLARMSTVLAPLRADAALAG